MCSYIHLMTIYLRPYLPTIISLREMTTSIISLTSDFQLFQVEISQVFVLAHRIQPNAERCLHVSSFTLLNRSKQDRVTAAVDIEIAAASSRSIYIEQRYTTRNPIAKLNILNTWQPCISSPLPKPLCHSGSPWKGLEVIPNPNHPRRIKAGRISWCLIARWGFSGAARLN